MPNLKSRTIRRLLEFVEEDLKSLIDSNTFPVGDETSLDPDLLPEVNRLRDAIKNAHEVLERSK